MSEQEPDPVVVVGDLMLDEAWFGRRDRVCPDAASPVFRVQRRESALGGAARGAKVLVDLGVPVEVVGVIGNDLAGRELLGLLQEHGIGVDGVVVDAHRPTTMKRSHFEGTHARANTKVFRVDLESQDPLPLKLRAKLEQLLWWWFRIMEKGSWMNLWCGRAKARRRCWLTQVGSRPPNAMPALI